jgi:hypothetical protein
MPAVSTVVSKISLWKPGVVPDLRGIRDRLVAHSGSCDHPTMSYDLAVWEGDQPANDREAAAIHETLYDRYVDAEERTSVTPGITRFVETLVRRWPDSGEHLDDDSPWSAAPLIREASGPYIYFTMSYSRVEASAHAAQVAREQGLICFDPQQNALRR